MNEEKKLDKSEVISVRINKQEERQALDRIKEILSIKEDGTALKISAFIGEKVLQNVFGKEILTIILNKLRVKKQKKHKSLRELS